MRSTLLITLFSSLLLLNGCPSDDDDFVADDDTGDDDTGDDDTGDDDDDSSDDDSSDDDTGDDDTTQSADVMATVTVPSGFSAIPTRISLYFMDPNNAQAPPAGVGFDADTPVIGDGTPFVLEGGFDDLTGLYIPVIVLRVEGGNYEGPPAEGIDWSWGAQVPADLGAGPLNLGTVELALLQGGPE